MILNDTAIKLWVQRGGVSPFNPELVNPASIDLRLGDEFINLDNGRQYKRQEITLRPGCAILATTLEYIKIPPFLCGVVYLKSSLARQGLDHALAGWVDPGFSGTLTLEFHAHCPVTLQAGQPVIQLVLQQMIAEPELDYSKTGRYHGQTGPTMAR